MLPDAAAEFAQTVGLPRETFGELFDLENDPWEQDSLWDNPEHAELKHRLIAESFDVHVLRNMDVNPIGSRRCKFFFGKNGQFVELSLGRCWSYSLNGRLNRAQHNNNLRVYKQ